MKKYEAKQFACTYLVPNFINLLSLSPELKPLVTHIMKTPMPIRGYLCYLLMKAKIGERKQQEWKNLLRDRMIQQLVDKTRGLKFDLANMNMSDGAQKGTELDNRKLQDIKDKMKAMEDNQKADHAMVDKIAHKQRGDHTTVHTLSRDFQLKAKTLEEKLAQTQRDDQALAQTMRRDLQLHQVQLTSHEGQLEDIHEDARSLPSEAVSAFTSSLDSKFATLTSQVVAPEPPNPSIARRPSYERLRNCTDQVED